MSAFLSRPVRQSELLGCVLTALQTEDARAADERAPLNAQTTAPIIVTASGHASVPVAAGVALRALMVEHSPVNFEIAELLLEALGYSVETAHNGVQAVAHGGVPRSRFDLVLMDCQMPEMHGYLATRRIRELQAGVQPRLAIVALTANALGEHRDACRAAGTDDYLAKPFSQAQLEATMRRNMLGR